MITLASTQDRVIETTTSAMKERLFITNSKATGTSTCDSSIFLREIIAWVLVIMLTVLFIGLLSVVLLWMFKKRQAKDTSTDNNTPKYEMEGNPYYQATAVKQTTDTHLYEAVRGGGDK